MKHMSRYNLSAGRPRSCLRGNGKYKFGLKNIGKSLNVKNAMALADKASAGLAAGKQYGTAFQGGIQTLEKSGVKTGKLGATVNAAINNAVNRATQVEEQLAAIRAQNTIPEGYGTTVENAMINDMTGIGAYRDNKGRRLQPTRNGYQIRYRGSGIYRGNGIYV